MCAAAGLALYSGEVERHWIEINSRDITVPGLHAAFDGLRVAQLSDIHFDEFTEAFFLRNAVDRINSMKPDIVFLTGDFVTSSPISRRIFKDAAPQCAMVLNDLNCSQRYACLGNHDFQVNAKEVTEALTAHGITVLNNNYVPIERNGARFWLAGIEDPVEGQPNPDVAIPVSIRNVPNEPVVLLCHAPDYVDNLLAQPAGQAIAVMLSGHTHGGQICLPFVGPLALPAMGRKYVKGWFRFGSLQLHVNRGIGTVNLPFRFNCPPEITFLTLRST
jgi:uncharacterized protein